MCLGNVNFRVLPFDARGRSEGKEKATCLDSNLRFIFIIAVDYFHSNNLSLNLNNTEFIEDTKEYGQSGAGVIPITCTRLTLFFLHTVATFPAENFVLLVSVARILVLAANC